MAEATISQSNEAAAGSKIFNRTFFDPREFCTVGGVTTYSQFLTDCGAVFPVEVLPQFKRRAHVVPGEAPCFCSFDLFL